MSYGCELKDYTVTIGYSECVKLEPLYDNLLICHPPQEEPYDKYPEREGAPRIEVVAANRI